MEREGWRGQLKLETQIEENDNNAYDPGIRRTGRVEGRVDHGNDGEHGALWYCWCKRKT
jgi:hypothetical protein